MATTGDSILKQDEILAFLKGYAPSKARAGEKDLLAGRYRIAPNQPLVELSTSNAKACVARDEQSPDSSLYALIFESGVPLRQKNINALKTYRHPSLVSLLAEGVIDIGPNAEPHYVIVLQRPIGQTLAQIFSTRNEPMSEGVLVQKFLRPLTEILVAFAKIGISHNRIHPGNVYVSGSNVMLGECIGEPSGFSQDMLFEPIERMLTNPRAKADFAPSADCYALGVLVLHLTLGYSPFGQANREILIRDILTNGAYHTLVMPWDLPVGLQDFFRGIFNDAKRDRWEAAAIESWLSGRKFNLILPSSPRETSHGFEFADKLYFNCKSLANALAHNWKEAKSLLGENRLGRWLKVHAHKTDTADAINRISPIGKTLTPPQEDEALARVIMLLDPSGPLRFKQISMAVEGIGALLANALAAERPEDVRAITQIIDYDLIGFWIEQQKKATPENAAFTTRLQKARSHLRMKGVGFGMERCLYDMNPDLPCQSPMLKGHPAMTLTELLNALDAVSVQKAATEDFGDSHIAAFMANRLDLNREMKASELQAIPGMATNQGLIQLKLMAQAQRKAGAAALKGLGHWVVLRLLPLLSDMHSRVRQKKLVEDMRTGAGKGSLEAIAQLLLSSHAFEVDRREFRKAAADYAARRQHIEALKGSAGIALEAGIKGRGVAQSIAYSVCLVTVYATLKSYFHL